MKLLHGDCLELMQTIPDGSVDMILCDLPYGTTACKWDTVIPFEPLWAQYRRIAKRNAAIVLTASQPFTTVLISSNMREFRHEWIWDKVRPSGMQTAKYKPMPRHESVCVFGAGRVPYMPIMEKRDKPISGRIGSASLSSPISSLLIDRTLRTYTHKYPQSIIKFCKPCGAIHPTQKPTELFEYLIRTYTSEGETVLDNCMGSGTTGVACANTGREFIGIERDDKYFEIARNRINDTQQQLRMIE